MFLRLSSTSNVYTFTKRANGDIELSWTISLDLTTFSHMCIINLDYPGKPKRMGRISSNLVQVRSFPDIVSAGGPLGAKSLENYN